jgi:effector-binding domain-containing protein
MKITEPKLEDRAEQPYAGIRTLAAIPELPTVIPQLLGEVFAWLGKQGLSPAGPPFIRYHVINMESKMDIEMGVPVASAVRGDGRVSAGILPAGRYATLIYTGVTNGLAGNKALIDWARANGIAWDRWDDQNGDAFRSRYESFLTNPEDEPDQAKWETEVAIRLADDRAR